jgi:hypothetical protein
VEAKLTTGLEQSLIRGEVAEELSRRQFVRGTGALGAAALIASALPTAVRMAVPASAPAQAAATDGQLQAFFDTMIPGRRVATTDLGNPIHPQAIAGVDPEPGAVEADALLLSHHPKIGFDVLAPPFLAELEGFALAQGGDFLSLGYAARERVCMQGLAFSNPTRVVWEAAAAIPFTAFCAAATQRNATRATASGYQVMGHPGTARRGYRKFSYRRKLAKGRTKKGYLP